MNDFQHTEPAMNNDGLPAPLHYAPLATCNRFPCSQTPACYDTAPSDTTTYSVVPAARSLLR
uniref:Uncharacterized protein n=1 Tax=Anopheles minimus TaxID=112268 RepID=A0A182WLH9_9DIPT